MAVDQLAPVVHSVHFYETDEALIQRLGSIVISGLDAGVSALLVMTDDHRRLFQQYLKRRGIDPHSAERDGFICMLEAESTLQRFIVDGKPDAQLFQDSVGQLVRAAQKYSRRAGLTVFGEMVALLWEEGNTAAALELEALWNGLLADQTFHLHCAYPKALFRSRKDRAQIEQICNHHSLAVGLSAAA